MNPIKHLYKKWQDRRADRYMHLLLEDRFRMEDIPDSLRMDPEYGGFLYTCAFRADRGIGDVDRYWEDLVLLEMDIHMAEQLGEKRTAADLRSIKTVREVEFADTGWRKNAGAT